MSKVWRTWQGDLTPEFDFQLTEGVPASIISDTRITNVHLWMGKEGRAKTDLGACDKLAYVDVDDPDPEFIVGGTIWRYSWVVGDTDKPGRYEVVARILWDTNKPQTVPNVGAFPLEILKR